MDKLGPDAKAYVHEHDVEMVKKQTSLSEDKISVTRHDGILLLFLFVVCLLLHSVTLMYLCYCCCCCLLLSHTLCD